MKKLDKTNREFVHLYVALRRKKENPDLQSACIRKIIYDDKQDLKILKTIIDDRPGIWRIHKTVNKRSCEKAGKLLMHKLIDDPILRTQMESLWKSCLLKPESRAERNFLLDIDSETISGDLIEQIAEKCFLMNIFCRVVKSPNGYHIVTPPFDIREIEDFKEVTVHRDGYIFVELYNVKNSDKKRRKKEVSDE